MQSETKQALLRNGSILLISATVGCAVCMLGLLVLAALFTGLRRIPQTVILPLTIAVALAGAWAAGMVAGRMAHRKGYLYGLAAGMLLFAVIYFCGMAITGAEMTAISALKLILMLLAGMIGGIMGVHRKRRLR